MQKVKTMVLGSVALLLIASITRAEVKITIDRNEGDKATADFKFKMVPAAAHVSAASSAKYKLIDGDKDDASGELDVLHDGKMPEEEDKPDQNFFFAAGSEGGRISIDLGKVIEVKEFNSYSWHPNTRAPQVYTLYGSDGTDKAFSAEPKKDVDPEKVGWTMITKVDTRPKTGDVGGQYGVSIINSDGALGKFRYMLMVVSRTESDDDFGNTFYSEINIVDASANKNPAPGAEKKIVMTVKPQTHRLQSGVENKSASPASTSMLNVGSYARVIEA